MKRYIARPILADTEIYPFKIPVIWKMRAVIPVNARSLKEAVKIVNSCEYELPKGEYVEKSYEIDYDRLEE